MPSKKLYSVCYTVQVEHVGKGHEQLNSAIKEKESLEKDSDIVKVWIEEAETKTRKMTDRELGKASTDRKTPRDAQSEATQVRNNQG